MPLQIETFRNGVGGSSLYKALTHPLTAEPAQALLDRLAASGPVAIYDPDNIIAAFDAFHPLKDLDVAGLYVQNVAHLVAGLGNHAAQPVTELPKSRCRTVFLASFEAARVRRQIGHLIPEGAVCESFESLKLPDDMLSDRKRYLNTLNFATNFVFFRDAGGHHTRLVSANYWTRYGAKDVRVWCRLFDQAGKPLATWSMPCPDAEGSLVIDSAEVRARFSLPEFTGQLFVHVVGAAGHDIVKYALDTYGEDEGVLSQTHDANSWPADLYAGLPAPEEGEDVVLWVQNSHPGPIPANEIGLGLMGGNGKATLAEEIASFATRRLSVRELLPEARWPQQIEIQAGKHVVRPRYEVVSANGHVRISHPNVERGDLKPDAAIPRLGAWFGKGFILPAPVLSPGRYRTTALPTPMSTTQMHLPLKVLVYDPSGEQVAERALGNLARADSVAVDVTKLAGDRLVETGGHCEMVYDFEAGDEADGWLHALFRYADSESGHAAETSFGAHIFNSALTWRGEPQSYSGPPPGLSTRLFLRIAPSPQETVCHLIYPVSAEWHPQSDTALILMSEKGHEIARQHLRVPASGSRLWRVSEMFDATALRDAGAYAYVIVRDETCRLFGYQGAFAPDGSFGFDHMFGF
jgi:hypothetical protein